MIPQAIRLFLSGPYRNGAVVIEVAWQF
jgi:hypothetical protein